VLEKQAGSYLNHDGMQGIEFPAEIYDWCFNVCRITPSSKKNLFLHEQKVSSNIIFIYLIFQILGQTHDMETSLLLGIEPRFLGHMADILVAISADLQKLQSQCSLEVIMLLFEGIPEVRYYSELW
jgi:hypothetical protein